MHLVCIHGMYWHVMACIWYVMACQCLKFWFSKMVFSQCECIDINCGVYWYVFGEYWHILKHNMCWSEPGGLCCGKYCCMYWVSVWRVKVDKASCFQVFSTIHGPSTFVTFPQRLSGYNHYIHTHSPGQHMWLSHGPLPDSKCSKTVEVWYSCQELKSCQLKLATD